ncbi:hypothetical protein OS493_014656 [Desmophyllum pertusum]|uniref:Activin types I and II receptor domain-containing protein n=1 Tax=Desmophyllum pertusum TaxID=174260 RepID=A0A9W9YEP1_9CNID|nr:hypothetical protein OS493_014656 [Desmophyllum pertusum]
MQKVIFVLLLAITLKVTLVHVEALKCVEWECNSVESCNSLNGVPPEVVECSGKCFTYETTDTRHIITKGCYPASDAESSCSSDEECDNYYRAMIEMFAAGDREVSCRHQCCDHDECNAASL